MTESKSNFNILPSGNLVQVGVTPVQDTGVDLNRTQSNPVDDHGAKDCQQWDRELEDISPEKRRDVERNYTLLHKEKNLQISGNEHNQNSEITRLGDCFEKSARQFYERMAELSAETGIGLNALLLYSHHRTLVNSDSDEQDVLEAVDHQQFVKVVLSEAKNLRDNTSVVDCKEYLRRAEMVALVQYKRETKDFVPDARSACPQDSKTISGDLFSGIVSDHRLQVKKNSPNFTPFPRDASLTAILTTSTASLERSYTLSLNDSKVIEKYHEFWRNGILCDTQLIVQGEKFNIHRAFLAARSPYFNTMFTKEFEEKYQNQVELKGVTAIGLRSVLECYYTGRLVINRGNVEHVFQTADHLQFTEILQFCLDYLKVGMTVDNCLHFHKVAEKHALGKCKREIEGFILDNFARVASNEDFKTISGELFCKLLGNDRLKAQSELEVLNLAINWLDKKPQPRPPELVKEVLGQIRYGLINVEQMEDIVFHPLLLSESCRDVLQNAVNYHWKLFRQPLITSQISHVRAYRECLVILGAGCTSDSTLCTSVLAATTSRTSGQLGQFVTLMPIISSRVRYFAATAVVNGFVFVIGGQSAMVSDGSNATDSAFRFNPRDGKWLQLSSMTVPRTQFALVGMHTCLIAVGGRHGDVALSSAEKYDFYTGEWSIISSLPNTLFSHAGCAHAGRVYISGGWPGENFTDEMHSCDIDSGSSWQVRAPMKQARGYHVMVTHNSSLFVAGGDTNVGERRDITTVEKYNTDTDVWATLSPFLYGQISAPSAICCGPRMILLGGYNWNAHSFQDTVEAYNLDSDTWELSVNHLPRQMTGVVACHVKVPHRLLDDSASATLVG